MSPQPLARELERLAGARDPAARIANDPIRFVRRYAEPADIEIAALLAGTLAYGRVAAFSPVIERLLAQADAHGGPAAWVRRFDPRVHGPALESVAYRFNRAPDHALLLAGLRELLAEVGSLGALVVVQPEEADIGPALSRLVQRIRAAIRGLPEGPPRWEAAPPGLRYLLPDPADGSAAKRLCMVARWLVRPADGVDLGVWTQVDPARLVIPLDTHVHRIARLVGLTARRDPSWRTAVEITGALAKLDPADPVRFDFALAHLGISDRCTGALQPAVCGPCALRAACRVGRSA